MNIANNLVSIAMGCAAFWLFFHSTFNIDDPILSEVLFNQGLLFLIAAYQVGDD